MTARSYFSKLSFRFHLKNRHSSKDVFKILVETVKPFGCIYSIKQIFILQLPIPYCVSLTGMHTFFCLWRVNKKLPQGET